jgi:hypothetical protein
MKKAPHYAGLSAVRFNALERRHLLGTPCLGPGIVQRLEAYGVVSLEQLRSTGIDTLLREVCCKQDGKGLLNRRRALHKALSTWRSQSAEQTQIGAVASSSGPDT